MDRKTELVFFLLTATSVLPPTSSSVQTRDGDPWQPFKFLIGAWSGSGSEKPGEAAVGATSFSRDIDNKILVRKNRAEVAPKPGEKPMIHEDLMIIYPQSGDPKFRAVYFDNEGHVIHYAVSFPGKQPSVAFESEALQNSPRFRLTYETGANGELINEFLIAPPGGDFMSYLKGVLVKSP